MPKLVIVSDTHLRRPELPPGDILIHCGDALLRGNLTEFHAFLNWWVRVKNFYKHHIFVPGNHDRCLETDQSARDALTFLGTYLLMGNSVELMGLKFWGSPNQPSFNDWAFNCERGGDVLRETWEEIPIDTDVVITHCPPYGILDRLPSGESVGCELLRAAVTRVQPKLHAFGHIHEGYGGLDIDGTYFINASICDGAYRIGNKPVEIEIEGEA